MTEREEQIAQATQDFLMALPDKMKNGHLGSVICTMFEAFGLGHDTRVDICEGVLNVMLEHDSALCLPTCVEVSLCKSAPCGVKSLGSRPF